MTSIEILHQKMLTDLLSKDFKKCVSRFRILKTCCKGDGKDGTICYDLEEQAKCINEMTVYYEAATKYYNMIGHPEHMNHIKKAYEESKEWYINYNPKLL
jgi:hypothetical protein